MELSKELIGAASFLIGLYGSCIYIRSILKGQTKPHLFTWITFALISGIAFLAQIYDHAGPGSWALSITVFFCASIAFLSLKYGDKDFTRSDKLALAFSITAIIPWLLTKDPTGSVIMAAVIDTVAFYPTFRKSWHKPWSENLMSYNIANAKFVLSFFAMENFTFNTVFYTAVITVTNFALVLMCHIRRKKIEEQNLH